MINQIEISATRVGDEFKGHLTITTTKHADTIIIRSQSVEGIVHAAAKALGIFHFTDTPCRTVDAIKRNPANEFYSAVSDLYPDRSTPLSPTLAHSEARISSANLADALNCK